MEKKTPLKPEFKLIETFYPDFDAIFRGGSRPHRLLKMVPICRDLHDQVVDGGLIRLAYEID